MPLTMVLRDQTHPATRWMHQHWPAWPEGWNAWTHVIQRAAPLVYPTRRPHYPWAMVGHAWQYGFALRWGLSSLAQSTARYGIAAWVGWPPDPRHWAVKAWQRLQHAGDAYLAHLQPIPPAPPDRFWSLCWTLAHWESAYRSGQPEPAIETAWRTRRPIPLPADVRDDLVRITQRFAPVESSWRQQGLPVQLSPAMPDGYLVGGADGDVIIGQTLWDFKITVRPLNAEWWLQTLWQLIGYWLLDGPNAFDIQFIGIALPRQGITWFVPITDVLAASGRHQSEDAWREEFRHVLCSA